VLVRHPAYGREREGEAAGARLREADGKRERSESDERSPEYPNIEAASEELL